MPGAGLLHSREGEEDVLSPITCLLHFAKFNLAGTEADNGTLNPSSYTHVINFKAHTFFHIFTCLDSGTSYSCRYLASMHSTRRR